MQIIAEDVDPAVAILVAAAGNAKLLTTELAQWASIVITMGCGDSCPVIPGKRYIDWDLTDPKDLSIDDVRKIRDDIVRRVDELVESMSHAENLKFTVGDGGSHR